MNSLYTANIFLQINNFLHTLCNKLCILGGYGLLCVVVLTSVNIVIFSVDLMIRSLGLNVEGLPGYEDFVYLVVADCVLLFFPYCQLHQSHISLDFFDHYYSEKSRLYFKRLNIGVTIFIYGFLGYWFLAGLIESYNDNILSSVLLWPVWLFYTPGIMALFLSCFIALYQFLNSFR